MNEWEMKGALESLQPPTSVHIDETKAHSLDPMWVDHLEETRTGIKYVCITNTCIYILCMIYVNNLSSNVSQLHIPGFHEHCMSWFSIAHVLKSKLE